ncbi:MULTISPECIES: hypothetical protein [Bradyrhizobium]|uniref:Uncharacterized protein n=1 Tax=Bradyrhizobium arachidis TaxID=858423 RepID=A0AAE7TFA7_9BRAD|nr:hypothetical protein [Bradyrhizobium arachidis]QOZ66340.1 hypothetical protein WN72_07895 [Bradyrhizobium arachidis]SFV07156.1 hypothetical protein SAMN05192541_11321 [Bradyrhizobium arachidis]
MTDSSTTHSESLTHASADAGPAKARRRPTVVRVVMPRPDLLDDLPDSEREFSIESRKVVQRLADNRKKAAERRERDEVDIESLANAMLELGNEEDPESFRDLPIASVAAMAEVDVKRAERLRRDAFWLARDHVVTDPAVKASETAYQRNLRIATDALTSGLVKTKHLKASQKPYSPRQATLIREHCRQEEYLRRMADEPRAQSHIVERHDADGVVTTRHQSARDRFDPGGRGYVGSAGYVGGSSTQENGGTCWQDEYVEKGKRSDASVMDQRYLEMTPKAPGKRRKGISDKKTIQRIQYLDGIGKAPEEIAADEFVKETVSRVKGALHSLRFDTRHWAGDNNDRRAVHLKKWVGLDQIHGNTRTDCREIIRVDKDYVFESWQECEDHLNTLKVRPQKVNFVRDDAHPERVTKPHYLYYLPDGNGVWYDESTGMAMLEAAAAALTIDAGGDIGGLANIGDVKQPTSPRVVSIDMETEHLPTLSELCKILDVDLKQNLVVTMRQQSVASMVEAGISETQSGAIYSLAWKRGIELCGLWERLNQLRVDAELDRRRLGVEVFDALLEDRFMADHLRTLRASALTAAENSIRVAAKKVAESYGRGLRASSRGYDLRAAEAEVKKAVADVRATASSDLTPAELKKLEIHAAQSIGQVHCNRVQVQRSVRRIADAMLEISKTGAVPDQKAVRKLTGMHRTTVGNHWDAAIAIKAANAIVAVIMDAPPVAPEPENHPSAAIATDRAECSGVRGVTGTDSRERQPGQPVDQPSEAIPATSGETLTIETMIPATMLPLVNGLRPWNPGSGETQTGRALLEFCRPGFRIYRSKLGIREEARRELKGRPASGKSGSHDHLDDADVWPEAAPA